MTRLDNGVRPRAHNARMSRCPTPEKVRYRDEIAAKLALMKLGRQDKDGHHENRAYRCPCGGWHLTSKPKRRGRKVARTGA